MKSRMRGTSVSGFSTAEKASMTPAPTSRQPPSPRRAALVRTHRSSIARSHAKSQRGIPATQTARVSIKWNSLSLTNTFSKVKSPWSDSTSCACLDGASIPATKRAISPSPILRAPASARRRRKSKNAERCPDAEACTSAPHAKCDRTIALARTANRAPGDGVVASASARVGAWTYRRTRHPCSLMRDAGYRIVVAGNSRMYKACAASPRTTSTWSQDRGHFTTTLPSARSTRNTRRPASEASDPTPIALLKSQPLLPRLVGTETAPRSTMSTVCRTCIAPVA